MSYRVERVDGSNVDDYRAFVETCPHAIAQHSWDWLQAIEAVGEDEPFHLLCRDQQGRVAGVLPAFRFKGPYGSILVSSPQAGGYGGIVFADDADLPRLFEALIAEFLNLAKQTDCCVATICTPPFQEKQAALYRTFMKPDYVRDNFYQYTELSEDFIAHFPKRVRNPVRRAQAAGFVVDFEDSQEAFIDWYALHVKRMKDFGASPIALKLLQAARAARSGLSRTTYVRDGITGKIIGGVFYIRHGAILEVFSMIADTEYFQKGAVALLMAEVITRVFAEAVRILNWSGTPSRESGAYKFKTGWNAVEGSHYYMSSLTGDAKAFLSVPLEEIKRAYRGHFVLPYKAWEAP